jgi:hypothetical protein
MIPRQPDRSRKHQLRAFVPLCESPVKTCDQAEPLVMKPRVEELAASERTHTKAQRHEEERRNRMFSWNQPALNAKTLPLPASINTGRPIILRGIRKAWASDFVIFPNRLRSTVLAPPSRG